MRNQFDEYYTQKDEWESGTRVMEDCTYQCMCKLDSIDSCDPFSQISLQPTKAGSMLCLLGIYGACYIISWFILARLSTKYE